MAITAALVKELRERTGAGMMECKQALVETQGQIEQAIELMRKAGQIKAAKKASRVAADGAIVLQVSPDNKQAVILEINSETDFVANDTNFKEFAREVVSYALAEQTACTDQLNQSFEQARQALISRVGENIQIRRGALLKASNADEAVYCYTHGKKIGVLLHMQGGKAELGSSIAMHIAASNPEVLYPEDVPALRIEKEKEIFRAQADKEGKPAAVVDKMLEGRIKKFVNEVSLYQQEFVKDPSQTIGKILDNAKAKVIQFVRYELGEGIAKI